MWVACVGAWLSPLPCSSGSDKKRVRRADLLRQIYSALVLAAWPRVLDLTPPSRPVKSLDDRVGQEFSEHISSTAPPRRFRRSDPRARAPSTLPTRRASTSAKPMPCSARLAGAPARPRMPGLSRTKDAGFHDRDPDDEPDPHPTRSPITNQTQQCGGRLLIGLLHVSEVRRSVLVELFRRVGSHSRRCPG